MTVYEMLEQLQALVEQGYGSCVVSLSSDDCFCDSPVEQVVVADFGSYSEICIE